jgi:hypothetical protein
VRDRDIEIGRFGHNGRVGTPPGHERIGAEAGVLLIHDRGDDEATARKTASFGKHPGGAKHGGDAALHVLRAATV